MTETSHAVFLSYAFQDGEAARRICDALRAGGIEVWFDQSELRGGDAWDHHIRRQIADCALFVAIISAHTQARPEGYFRLEWDLADRRSHMIARTKAFVVPVCVDSTPERGAEVPESFLNVQWTRLPGGETRPAFVERVSSLIAGNLHVVQAAAGSPPASPPHRPTATVKSLARLRPLMLVMLAAALVAAGYLALDRFVLSKRLPQSLKPETSVQPNNFVQSKVPEKSVAVLPFIDMSEKHDQEYFSDGLSEELINQLAQNADLLVIARTSSSQFKAKSEDIRSIAARLGVANLLEGSVRKSAGKLRITVQLIRASDGAHVWSKTFDRTLDDVFKIQEEIANTVARELKTTLRERGAPQPAGTPKIEAFGLYLQALGLFQHLNNQGDFATELVYVRQALKLDPNYAAAWALLSRSLALEAEMGWSPAKLLNDEARYAAQQSIRLNPNLADAHAVLARILLLVDWDFIGAAGQLQTSLQIDPNNSMALDYASWLAAYQGDVAEALDLSNKAIRSDPANPWRYWDLSHSLNYAGRYPEALAAFRHALDLNASSRGTHCYIGQLLFFAGHAAAALDEINLETDPREQSECGGVRTRLYTALGRTADADATLALYEKEHAGDSAEDIASVYALRGDLDRSFMWLRRAYTNREISMLTLKVDPELKNLRTDQRYKALLIKMKLQ